MATNYIIEGNIDFFQELYKSLDTEELDENKDKNENNEFAIHSNVCLITNQPLENNFVKMKCGHKFTYIPFYKYFINYKQKFNLMENAKQKLDINEIRCPYCRFKQSELLPYYEDMKGIKKINGINNEYIKPKLDIKNPFCCYKYHLQDNTNFVLCGRIFTCQLPDEYKEKDSGYYCSHHIKKTIQKLHKIEKESNKKKKIFEKQKILEEKMKAKEEKLSKTKVSTNKSMNENIILDVNNTIYCQSIIKYGSNKGNHCSLKAIENGFCKRHLQLQSKNINNQEEN